MTIAIIGAGMAGLACAEALVRAGHAIVLFDKGRRPGGRMSTRSLETSAGVAGFDYGAQYMNARDPAFRARIALWASGGRGRLGRHAGHERTDRRHGEPARRALVGACHRPV